MYLKYLLTEELVKLKIGYWNLYMELALIFGYF